MLTIAENGHITSYTLDVELLVRMKRAEVNNSILCDAVFVVVLRQEIFIANLLQRPFKPFTDCCNIDVSLKPACHAAWTTRIIARAAELSNFAYEDGPRPLQICQGHRRYLEGWDSLKPVIFSPTLRFQPPDQVFPTIFSWVIYHLRLSSIGTFAKFC